MSATLDATQITPHLRVVCSDGGQFATVDHTDSGNSINLTKDESGLQHWIPTSWVTQVDGRIPVDRSGKQAMQECSTSNSGVNRDTPRRETDRGGACAPPRDLCSREALDAAQRGCHCLVERRGVDEPKISRESPRRLTEEINRTLEGAPHLFRRPRELFGRAPLRPQRLSHQCRHTAPEKPGQGGPASVDTDSPGHKAQQDKGPQLVLEEHSRRERFFTP